MDGKFLTDCQKKVLTDYFGQFFGQFFGKFWHMLEIVRQILCKLELFLYMIDFFLGGPFFLHINSDCGADLSTVRLEITRIRHDGGVYSSIRRRLPSIN